MNDEKIIKLLQKGKTDRAFAGLYKSYSKIERFIRSNGGTKEDAQDVFQEALLIFYEKGKKTDFRLTSTIEAYLYSTCRYKWKDELEKKNRRKTGDLFVEISSEEESELREALDREVKFQQIEKALNEVGAKCLELLKLFYYRKLRMKEIAEKVGLKSEKIAKNQKYKCLEKAKLKVKACA